jgi:IS30 family transposase
VNICNIRNHKSAIDERRQRLFVMLTRGMKGYEIAKELNVDSATVSRDIKFLTAESQNYLNDLARSILPFMYQTSIEGVRNILKECWNIYQSDDEKINWLQRLQALKLAKECHESVFNLLDAGPSIMAVKQLQERLIIIENRQAS